MSNVKVTLRKPWAGYGVNAVVMVPQKQADLLVERKMAVVGGEKKKPRTRRRAKEPEG